MTDQRIEGAATEFKGGVQNGLGEATGDTRLQLEGRFNELKGKAAGYYGQALDRLDGLVEKAPADVQGHARKGLDFARRKPLVTTGILAGLAILLTGVGRRR